MEEKVKMVTRDMKQKKLFDIAPPVILGGNCEQSDNSKDINSNNKQVIDNSKGSYEAYNALSNIFSSIEELSKEKKKDAKAAPPKNQELNIKCLLEKI